MEFKPIYKEITRFILTVAVASLGGGYFGFQKAMNAPVPAQFAVVDMAALARSMQKEIDPSKPSGQIAIREMGEAIKSRFKDLNDAGIVVLDSSMVIAAPHSSMIDTSDLLPAPSKAGQNADQKPVR